jgi:Flp pilus assembly protein TadG
MLKTRIRRKRSLKGQIMLMTAILTPVLLGGALISSDTAVLVSARAQMQSMTDASALAAAQQLVSDTRLSGTANITAQMNAANSNAVSISAKNPVLNATPVMNSNPTNSASGQIVVGYLSPTDYSSSAPDTTASRATFNSVQITGLRDASHGGIIPTFFGGPLGITGSSMTVKSTATAQNYAIQGYQSTNGSSANLLPIALDSTTYTAMMNGQTQDSYFWCSNPAGVSTGSDGVYESRLYPVSNGDPGNWGTVKIGVNNNSTSTLNAQITGGITPAELATFPGGVLQLDPSLSPPSITLSANPGLSAGIQSSLTSIIGKPVTIPIYDQTGGNGNNAWYRVINFAPVRIMAVNFQGNPKFVIVQPALVNDPTAIPGAPQSSWTQGGVVRVHLSR